MTRTPFSISPLSQGEEDRLTESSMAQITLYGTAHVDAPQYKLFGTS